MTDQVNLPENIVRAVKYIKLQAPLVHRFLRWHIVIEEESVEQVIERIHALLKNATGISYKNSFSSFKFDVSVKNYRGMQGCEIYIYRNEGEHKKPMVTSEMEGKQQFVVEFNDTSRYFTELFRYMIDSYSSDTIRPFSKDDLNYGLYSFYSWETVEGEEETYALEEESCMDS